MNSPNATDNDLKMSEDTWDWKKGCLTNRYLRRAILYLYLEVALYFSSSATILNSMGGLSSTKSSG